MQRVIRDFVMLSAFRDTEAVDFEILTILVDEWSRGETPDRAGGPVQHDPAGHAITEA